MEKKKRKKAKSARVSVCVYIVYAFMTMLFLIIFKVISSFSLWLVPPRVTRKLRLIRENVKGNLFYPKINIFRRGQERLRK